MAVLFGPGFVDVCREDLAHKKEAHIQSVMRKHHIPRDKVQVVLQVAKEL